MADRKPLLPQYRHSQRPISFPSSTGTDDPQDADRGAGSTSTSQPSAASLQHRIQTLGAPPERKPGLPKVTREVSYDVCGSASEPAGLW
jgi:hypothetical protein